MNEQECQAVYEQLTDILQNIEMGWVITLAAEEISTGAISRKKSKSQPRQLELFNERNEDLPVVNKKLPDIEVRDYTSREKLIILINYIQQSIVDAILMKKEIIDFLSVTDYFEDLNSSITFTSEIDDNRFIINSYNLEEEVQEAQLMSALLKDLIRMIDGEIER